MLYVEVLYGKFFINGWITAWRVLFEMRRDELPELHYITRIENLASILKHGIVSHRRAEEIDHLSVAMEEIQERRAKVTVPGGLRLHEYANLYINARNKMMFKRRCADGCEKLCIIRIDAAVLDIPGTVIADKNASSDYVAFRPAPNGLRFIDAERVFAQSWNHDDPIEKLRHGSEMCAEVLVPRVIPARFVQGLYVPIRAMLDLVTEEHEHLDVTINRHIFML